MTSILAQGSLVLFLIKATIILVGALLATLAMQRASAGARHLVWFVTLGTLLLVPALTAWGPLRLRVLPTTASATESMQPAATPIAPALNAAPSRGATTLPPTVSTTPAPGASASHATFPRVAITGVALAAVIWALVALAIVAVLLRDALVLRRIVRASTPLDAPEWRDMLWEISDRLELPDAPRLLRSAEAKMPFACGMRRATIVLPAESDGWSLSRRRAVLLHELAHVRRHDLVGHMLGRLACALYWFHPLVWTAAKQLRAESERACDDLALGCGTQASDYAEHLLDIVTSVRRASTPTVALAMARRKEFEGRMLAILDPDVRRAAPKRWQSGALVASLAAMAVLVGAATPAHKPAQHIVLAPSLRPTMPSGEVTLSDPSDATVRGRALQEGRSSEQPMPAPTPMPRVDTRVSSDVANHVSSSIANDVATNVAAHVSPLTPRALAEVTSRAIARVRGWPAGTQASGTPEERAALLVKVLQTDSSAEVRRTAAWGLAQLAQIPIASSALAAALLHDSDAGVRSDAAWGLAQSGRADGTVRDALVTALGHDADARVRSQAAWALGNIASASTLNALVAALRDPDAKVRSNAAWSIGTIAPRQAPQGVVDALRDTSEHVRANAAWALFNIHDRATAPALNAAFQHERSERVQRSEIEALGMMGDAGLPTIRAAINSSNPRVKRAAVEALSMHFDPDPDPNPDPNP